MPFSSITILIAESDNTATMMWERICADIGFNVVTVATNKAGLEHILDAHMFICDLKLADGSANLLISKWVERNGGPLVCLSGMLSYEEIRGQILQGAYNAFKKSDFTTEMLRTLIVRYGKPIMLKMRLDLLEKRFKLQQAAIAGLTALVVGKELWNILVPFLVP